MLNGYRMGVKMLDEVVISPEASIQDAMVKLNAGAKQIALVVDGSRKLLGTVTDGDVRRGLLGGVRLDQQVTSIMNRNPTTVSPTTDLSTVLGLMRVELLHQLPIVDAAGTIIGLHLLDDFLTPPKRSNWVVLMVGGLGSRLHPLTTSCPKPLLKIGNKPILEIILETFISQGFSNFFLAINYLGSKIQQHFGDGDRWGVHIEYLEEKMRLGTAGPLSLLPLPPTEDVLVMNGDLLTQTSFSNMIEFHMAHGAVATMAVREYQSQVPYGVVHLDGPQIKRIEEKPVLKYFVNAGMYALSPKAISYIPKGTFYDMPSLFDRLREDEQPVVAYPVSEYWLDIGRHEEYEQAQREWVETDQP